MKIFVDAREPKNVINAGKKHFSEVVVKQLPVGDVVYEDLCIERKEISDFVGSVANGRVFQQARNMVKNYRRNWIIIVGSQKSAAFNRYVRFSVGNYLAAVASLEQLVSVIHVDNPTQFWKQCKFLFEKSTDGKDRMNQRVKRIERGTGDVYVDQLAQVPKIGPKKAQAIIDTFEMQNLYPLYHMSVKELMQVRGIGEKQASTIKEYFKGPNEK